MKLLYHPTFTAKEPRYDRIYSGPHMKLWAPISPNYVVSPLWSAFETVRGIGVFGYGDTPEKAAIALMKELSENLSMWKDFNEACGVFDAN
jgi:hypothetical protein